MTFPTSKAYIRLKGAMESATIFDVKFFPYSIEADDDPVFAAVARRDIFVCRPGTTARAPIEVLRVFRDPQEESVFNSLVWSQDPNTGDPLVCVAGAGSRKIKILNVRTGNFSRVIRGHGGDINDLVISPASSQILASCSTDYAIRLWNLESQYEKQPCAAILAGEGHRQSILTLSFHASGKYIISGGQDAMICLWALPENVEENAGKDQPALLYFPHFASIDVHSDYVDCVKFWGDYILSRSSVGGVQNDKVKRGDIVLWKIEGFSSVNPTPAAPPVDRNQHTRSAFGGRFQRLLTFEMNQVAPWYMRFGLFDQLGQRPILVMGNEKARFSFWDLQALEEGYVQPQESASAAARNTQADSKGKKKAYAPTIGAHLSSESTPNGLASNNSSARNSHVSTPSTASERLRKFKISDHFAPIPAHKTTVVKCPVDFACRAVSWSNDGKWCVGVGDSGIMALFKR